MLYLSVRRQAAERRRRQPLVLLGTAVGVGAMVFVMIWAILLGAPVVPVIGICLTTCLVLVAVFWFVPWSRVPGPAMMVVPAVWLLGLAAAGAVIGPATNNFTGLTALAFLSAGLTQRRGRSLWLLLIALPVWVLMAVEAGGTNNMWVRLPVVLIVWITCAELTAFQTSGMRRELGRLDRKVDLDPLTRLANRRILPTLMLSVEPGDGIVLIDIDHFKSVNDTHGHVAGDLVLETFARLLRRCLRIDDTALRYGGEEMLVVLSQPSPARLREFDDQLRREILAIRPAVSFTAGVSVVAAGESAEDALDRADITLYEMKASGRNRTGGDIDGGRDISRDSDLTPR